MNAGQQLIEEIARARRLLERENEWLNYAVTTDHDEGLHLVVEGNEVKKFEARIGTETIQFSAL